MQQHGIDLLLAVSPLTIHYLIGARAKSYQELQCLLFPLEDAPAVMLARRSDVAELREESLAGEVRGWGGSGPEDPVEATMRLLDECGWRGRRIGLEAPRYYLAVSEYLRLREGLGESLVADATQLVEELKLVKSPAERAWIRRAARIADAGMRTCAAHLAPGRSELEVAGEILRTTTALGGGIAASPMNFASGERSCYGHAMPGERQLRHGDFVHVDFGVACHGYTATIARDFSLGPPGARARELHDAVQAACEACIAAIRPGVPAAVPHRAAREVLLAAGLDEYRLHTTGYGLAPGFPPAWSESLHLVEDSPHVLEAGMALTVEPPVLIHAEHLGARLIENVIVTPDGCEVLSALPRDLIVV